eukprot:TRINITY_DN24093_c0_g1_i1.p1 TRINITY_DN24093_c0_g1~~TRINITY_DN24093_c0_g1_i1.p1  ORF type:complete len:335 (+),score=18.18 TRINITY_DN24093_c0_g1_i1:48-1052(+)
MSIATWRIPAGLRSGPSIAGEAASLALCSIFIGSVPAFPILLLWLWRRARALNSASLEEEQIKKKRRAWAMFFGALAAYLSLMFMPVKRRPRLTSTYAFKSLLEYFSVRYTNVNGEPLPPGQYLFAMMPHGLYPFGGACASVSELANVFSHARGTVASAALWVPMIRQLMGWVGCVPANSASMSAVLRAGESLFLVPGGIAEMLRTERSRERLVLEPRKGFIKLALEHQVPIVPVYIFGQSTLWDQLPLPSWMEWISRACRISFFLPWGRFGLLLPRKQQLLYAIGSPIDCTCNGAPDQTRIDEIHRTFINAVKTLYDVHKEAYGWGNRDLIID